MSIDTKNLREIAGKQRLKGLGVSMPLLRSADAIDAQEAEIARLREVLTELLGWQSTAPQKVIDEARAVLEQ